LYYTKLNILFCGTIFSSLSLKNNMKSNKEASDKNSVEKVADLKKATTAKEPVQKGYNEKNPTQPQGAFKPDSAKK
jgi:hypothetical protein